MNMKLSGFDLLPTLSEEEKIALKKAFDSALSKAMKIMASIDIDAMMKTEEWQKGLDFAITESGWEIVSDPEDMDGCIIYNTSSLHPSKEEILRELTIYIFKGF